MDLNGDGREDLVSGSWPSKLYYFLATEDGWAESAELLDPLGDPLEYGQATNVAGPCAAGEHHDFAGDPPLVGDHGFDVR